MIDKQWKLHLGCHRRTLMSRDASVESYDSLEECREVVANAERAYSSTGYCIWYAYAVGPDGEQVKLHDGNSYR